MASQRVTLSIPKGLYEQLIRLIESGYYESLAEAVRSGLRRELAEAYTVVPAAGLTQQSHLYLRRLGELRQMIADAEKTPKDKQEILNDLRRIREEVWQERHSARA